MSRRRTRRTEPAPAPALSPPPLPGGFVPAPVLALAAAEPTSLRLRASAPVELVAAAAEGKRPTFKIVGYTGAIMGLQGFYSPVIVDLAGLRTASQEIPALFNHDPERIVGMTDSVKVDAKGVQITGLVTGENADALEVVSQGKNGFKWQASIGATIDRREFLDQGKTATVNGRTVTGPLVIARESTLKEISFVAIGADGATSASVAASNPPGPQHGTTSMNFDQWVQAKGFDPAALSDVQRSFFRAMFDQEFPPGGKVAAAATTTAATATATTQATEARPSVTATLDQIVKAQRDEDARVARITELTGQAISARPGLIDEFERLAKSAIEAKSPVLDLELALLRLRANAAGAGPAVHSARAGSPEARAGQSVIEAAVCKAGRLSNLEKQFDARTLEAADRHFRHGIGLQELLLIGARENGYHGHTASDVKAVLRAAFEVRADGFSMVNIPGTLSNVMNKFLVDYFNAVESAWRDVVAIRNVRDFKQVSSYSLTGDLTYELVGTAGELKSGTLGEAKYTNQAQTYGKLLAITRQDIINDDLGALMRVPQRLGRGAALKLNDVIWTTFLAGVGSFWAAGNGNLVTGATTTLTAVGLTAALLKFRQQTDPDGKPLGLTPRVLLVPPELEVVGKQLMNSTFFNTGGSSTVAQVPNMNTWMGAYKLAASTYLSNTTYTGNSATAWWLLADPADLPTIELAVLNGREVPIIESAEAELSTLGIQVRGYHDFGASLQEQRGSVRSAGA